MICIPIKKASIRELLSTLDKANKLSDLYEIWFDEIQDLNKEQISKIFKKANKPIIYKYSNNSKNFQNILSFKPKYIDVDFNSAPVLINEIKDLSPNSKIIISYHNYKLTPPLKELKSIIENMWKKGAEILKIATRASSLSDSLLVLSLLEELHTEGNKAICICMGEKGRITRSTGHIFGNYLMYAPFDKEDSTAPGQITAGELKRIIELT
ncbi:type I 3-dehydroquinate dehydratase [Candidatus Peregrinibacteria bacterium]|nr:type I 3-dehydroquinate dehydratase [Candidatus Peregrinibacteria bacterium]